MIRTRAIASIALLVAAAWCGYQEADAAAVLLLMIAAVVEPFTIHRK